MWYCVAHCGGIICNITILHAPSVCSLIGDLGKLPAPGILLMFLNNLFHILFYLCVLQIAQQKTLFARMQQVCNYAYRVSLSWLLSSIVDSLRFQM